MRITRLIILLTFIVLSARPLLATPETDPPPPKPDEHAPDAAQPPPAQAEKRRGVEGGFALVHGHYVDPPYKFSIKDFQLILNETHVLIKMQPPKKLPVGPLKDPGEFTWTPEKLKQRLAATGFVEHAWDKTRYWVATYGAEKGWQMTIDYYKAQPIVKKVDVSSESTITVWDTNGDCFSTGDLYGLKGLASTVAHSHAASEEAAEKQYAKDSERILGILKDTQSMYEKRLASGGAVFICDGGTRTVSNRVAGRQVNEMGAILRSKVSDEEKAKALRDYLPSPRSVDELVKNWGGVWPMVEIDEPKRPRAD